MASEAAVVSAPLERREPEVPTANTGTNDDKVVLPRDDTWVHRRRHLKHESTQLHTRNAEDDSPLKAREVPPAPADTLAKRDVIPDTHVPRYAESFSPISKESDILERSEPDVKRDAEVTKKDKHHKVIPASQPSRISKRDDAPTDVQKRSISVIDSFMYAPFYCYLSPEINVIRTFARRHLG